jgi:hypothetical protein
MHNYEGPMDADYKMLREYGSIEALECKGFFGTVDRLKQESPIFRSMANVIVCNSEENELTDEKQKSIIESPKQTSPKVENMTQQTTEQMVIDFCKSTKVSRAKVTALVEQLKATMPKRAGGGGKPLSHTSKSIRDHIATMQKEQPGCKFTSAELAEKFNVHPAIINNNLQWHVANTGLVVKSGIAPRPAGQRGKPATLWQTKA